MPKLTTTRILLASLALALIGCEPAIAKKVNYAKTLTGNWGGTRKSLHQRGIDLKASYTGEFAHNLTGGKRHVSAYADQFILGADLDFQKLWGWNGASLHVLITQRGGTDMLEDKAGITAFEQAQEVFGRGKVRRLTALYYEQKLWNDLIDIRVGRMEVGGTGARFFAGKCYFENLVACGSLPGNVVGNYWYNLPISQYAGVVTINPTADWYVRVGAIGVNPNNLDTDMHLRFTVPGGWGSTMWIGEFGWKGPLGAHKLPAHFAAGAWHNTENLPSLLPATPLPSAVGQPMGERAMEQSADGYYVLATQQITQNGNGGGLTVFVHVVQADPDTDRLDQLENIGFTYSAPFASRPHDRFQFVIGRTHASPQAIEATRLQNLGSPHPEPVPGSAQYTLEVDYVVNLWHGVNLMPVYQYITNPGGVSTRSNYSVFGMRLAVKF